MSELPVWSQYIDLTSQISNGLETRAHSHRAKLVYRELTRMGANLRKFISEHQRQLAVPLLVLSGGSANLNCRAD